MPGLYQETAKAAAEAVSLPEKSGSPDFDFQRQNRVVQLGRPPNRIDTAISGVSFDEAWQGRQVASWTARAEVPAPDPV